MLDSLITSCGISPSAASAGAGACPAGADAALSTAAGDAPAPSRSAFTTRPPGPEPWTLLRSMPDASASRLASGLALTRSPFCAGAADAFSEATDDASAAFATSRSDEQTSELQYTMRTSHAAL